MPLFQKIFYHARSAFQRRSYVSYMKSLAQAVLKICLIISQKFRGHLSSHTPLGKLFKQHSAFHMQISYWPNLKSAAQIIIKIFGIVWNKFLPVTWPRPYNFPFGENYLSARLAFPRRSGLPNLKSVTQVVLKIFSIVCQKLRGHVT